MAVTQEHVVRCGTGTIPVRLSGKDAPDSC